MIQHYLNISCLLETTIFRTTRRPGKLNPIELIEIIYSVVNIYFNKLDNVQMTAASASKYTILCKINRFNHLPWDRLTESPQNRIWVGFFFFFADSGSKQWIYSKMLCFLTHVTLLHVWTNHLKRRKKICDRVTLRMGLMISKFTNLSLVIQSCETILIISVEAYSGSPQLSRNPLQFLNPIR